MEILGEIGFALLEVLGEVFLQAFGEILFEVTGHSLRETFRRPQPLHPVLAGLGYVCWGAILGGISLWLFPEHFIKEQWLRVLNLVATPIVVGLIMARIGAWRRRREQEPIRLDTFAYGFCFAFAMALVRFIWAK